MTAETKAPERSNGGTPPAAPLLVVDDIHAGYGDTPVLRGVSIEVSAGAVVAVLGPNGAGKTTLLRAVSGIIHPTQGRVILKGEPIHRLPPEAITRRGLCHIPEGRGIFPSLTVEENLILQSVKGKESAAKQTAAEAFPQLAGRMKQTAGSLSGGEQQMLALARTYLADTDIVVVDEASLGLAPVVVDRIFQTLTTLAEAGKALLIVEQYISRALALASSAYILDRGRVVHSGPADQLRAADIAGKYLGIKEN